MAFSKASAERARDDLDRKGHRREEELLHTRVAGERLIAEDEQQRTGSWRREDYARERKAKAKLRGKEIGRQRALLHREERRRYEKERERDGEKERSRRQKHARRAGGVKQARNSTREPQKSASRSGCDSTPAVTENGKRGGDGTKGGDERDACIDRESRETQGGRRNARDLSKSTAGDLAGGKSAEPPPSQGRRGGVSGGDADFGGAPAVRDQLAFARRKSGHRDREARGFDKDMEKCSRSKKSERKEYRRRESQDHERRTVRGGNRGVFGNREVTVCVLRSLRSGLHGGGITTLPGLWKRVVPQPKRRRRRGAVATVTFSRRHGIEGTSDHIERSREAAISESHSLFCVGAQSSRGQLAPSTGCTSVSPIIFPEAIPSAGYSKDFLVPSRCSRDGLRDP